MHLVWDQWVSDKRGFFAVAVLDGRPIGTAKLTVLRPGEIWFEGLRVDPLFRGAGLSHRLTDFLLRKAEKTGARTVRYATGGMNLTSQHIGKSWGFKLLRRYMCFEAPPQKRRSRVSLSRLGPTRLLSALDEQASVGGHVSREEAVRRLTDLMGASRFLKSMKGLASRGWTFYSVDESFVSRASRRGDLLLARLRTVSAAGSGRRPVGLLVASRQRKRARLLLATLADFSEDHFPALLRAGRRLAYDLRLREVRIVLPYSHAMMDVARKVGYRPEYEGLSSVVMEKTLRR